MPNRKEKLRNLISSLEELSYHIADQEEKNIDILKNIISEQCGVRQESISLTLAECHVIDCIGRSKTSNNTAISKKLNITKGGISKITAKLEKKDMVETYRLETNRKEIYFRLRPLGQKIFEIHNTLHKKVVISIENALCTYSEKDLESASSVLNEIAGVFKSGMDAQVPET